MRRVGVIGGGPAGMMAAIAAAQAGAEALLLEGNEKLKKILEGGDVGIDYVCVLSELYDEVKDRIEEPLIPIDIFIIYPWLFRNPGKIIPEGPRGLSMR